MYLVKVVKVKSLVLLLGGTVTVNYTNLITKKIEVRYEMKGSIIGK